MIIFTSDLFPGDLASPGYLFLAVLYHLHIPEGILEQQDCYRENVETNKALLIRFSHQGIPNFFMSLSYKLCR